MPGTRTLRGMYAGSQRGRNRELEDTTPATATRSVEGSKPNPNKGGRPRGSKNRPKGLIPDELTKDMLPQLKKQLSPESFEYVEGVIRDGKPIETRRELDVMIAMLARNLMAALTHETTALKEAGFRKDITERLKILNSMLTLRHQIEKNTNDGDKPNESVLLKLVGDRNLLDGRLGVLVGVQPGVLAGDADRVERATVSVGAVPDSIPERPLLSTSGEQVEADWLLDGDRSGGASPGSSEASLQGELRLDQSEGSR